MNRRLSCIYPVRLEREEYYRKNGKILPQKRTYTVSCGKCFACRIKKTFEWTMRLSHEWTYYKNRVMFLTLTYDKSPEGYSLNRRDTQLFFKRLRKEMAKHGIKDIKYYLAGEYGEENGRPHYHVILFGVPNVLPYRRKVYKVNNKWNDARLSGFDYKIFNAWQLGEIEIGYPSNKGFRYVCNYAQKSAHMSLKNSTYFERYGRMKPFTSMSHNIGKRYCLDNAEQLYENGFIQFQAYRNGVPRTYRRWLQKEKGLDLHDKLKEYRFRQSENLIDELYKKNPRLKRMEWYNFSTFEDYYDLENHPDLYKVLVKERIENERVLRLANTEWKTRRRFYNKVNNGLLTG